MPFEAQGLMDLLTKSKFMLPVPLACFPAPKFTVNVVGVAAVTTRSPLSLTLTLPLPERNSPAPKFTVKVVGVAAVIW